MATVSWSHICVETEPTKCANCDWKGQACDTKPIKDVQDRPSPGDVVPCGECPECGCLAYLYEPTTGEYVQLDIE